MPSRILILSTAVQNNRTEISRGMIEIRPLCLDGFFHLLNRNAIFDYCHKVQIFT